MNVFFKHLTNEREERDWPVVGILHAQCASS